MDVAYENVISLIIERAMQGVLHNIARCDLSIAYLFVIKAPSPGLLSHSLYIRKQNSDAANRYPLWDTAAAVEVLPLGITYSLMLYSSNWALSLLTVPMVCRGGT